MASAISSDMLTRREAAAYLGVAYQTLALWACKGRNGIPFYRVGSRSVRYRRADLDVWLAERRVTQTA